MSDWPTYEEACARAGIHRDRFGDDVVQHLADDYDGFLGCQDCGWTTEFGPEPDDDYDEDDR